MSYSKILEKVNNAFSSGKYLICIAYKEKTKGDDLQYFQEWQVSKRAFPEEKVIPAINRFKAMVLDDIKKQRKKKCR